MKNCLFTFIIIVLVAGKCTAQTYIEPIAGFATDVANKAKFQQINTGVQVSFKHSLHYEFMVKLLLSSGLATHGNDSSFTANSSMPVYAKAVKIIHPNAWTLSADHRFIISGADKKDRISILLHTGFIIQKIKVQYQYDKANYTILNPDQTLENVFLFAGTGVEYMRLINDNRFFVQLTIDTPLTSLKPSYPSSFTYMAPLAVNVGYSFLIKKNKHEK